MKCRHCGTKVPAREEFCPSCGKYTKSTYFGISETRYKTIYAIYIFGISLLLLGLLYTNYIRILTGPMAFRGLRRALNLDLTEFIIIAIVAIITCLIVMIWNRLHCSLWKITYGVISTLVIFFIEFLYLTMDGSLSSSDFPIYRLHAMFGSLASLAIFVGLIIYGILLKENSDTNILTENNCEIVSAILISNIAVIIASVLALFVI